MCVHAIVIFSFKTRICFQFFCLILDWNRGWRSGKQRTWHCNKYRRIIRFSPFDIDLEDDFNDGDPRSVVDEIAKFYEQYTQHNVDNENSSAMSQPSTSISNQSINNHSINNQQHVKLPLHNHLRQAISILNTNHTKRSSSQKWQMGSGENHRELNIVTTESIRRTTIWLIRNWL